MKVDLIRPKTDNVYSSVKQVYSSFPPPVGLCCLGSALKEIADVKIYDANLVTPEFNADIIGIQDWVTTHKEAVKLAKNAKEQNPDSTVILGGVNASHLAERILNNYSFVDYVVCGHGEEALLGLVEGTPKNQIPNVSYREGESVKRSPAKTVRSLLFDLEQVVEWECDNNTPFPIAGIKGCIKALRKGICEYCALENEQVKIMSPDNFWKQIDILHKQYGLSFFFETGDEFNVGRYPEQLLKSRPDDLKDVSFRIYSYPESLCDESVIGILEKLNVREVYIGVETVNNDILKQAGRDYDKDSIENILKMFSSTDISVMIPFLFGLPGETNETAQRNFDFSQNLLGRYDNIKMIQYSLVVPIIGSNYFVMASSNQSVRKNYDGKFKKLSEDDNFDYELLTELFISTFSQADFDFLKTLVNKGKDSIKKSGLQSSTFIGVGESK